MTETKTKAQSRLQKLQESFKDSRKNPKIPALLTRGNQQFSNVLHKMTSPKPSVANSKPVFSPAKAKPVIPPAKVKPVIPPAKAKPVIHPAKAKPVLPPVKGFHKVKCSKPAIVNSRPVFPRAKDFPACRNGPVKNSLMRSDLSLNDPIAHRKEKYQQLNPIKTGHDRLSSMNATQLRRKPKYVERIEASKRNFTTPQKSPKKRKTDHENVLKKKVLKTQNIQDSSKNEIKSKHEKNKLSDQNLGKMKLPSLSCSYATQSGNSLSQQVSRQEKPKSSSSKDYHLKESIKSIPSPSKSITFQPSKNSMKQSLVEKNGKFKDKEELKQSVVSQTPKTKMQARLQKVLCDMKKKVNDSIKKAPVIGESTNIVNSSSNCQFVESMEWEPSNDEILRSTRNEVDPSEELMEWQDISSIKMQPYEKNSLCIVVDTNVLLRNIQLLKSLSKATIKGFKISLVIPWQVLKELDNLKTKVNYENVNISARKAINFLEKVTNNGSFNVSFQTQAQHFKEHPSFVVEVADDHLIKCCCQFKSEDQKVMLLSNDINLRIKTITNNIQAVDDKWMSNLLALEHTSKKKQFHCFETDPKEYQSVDIKNNWCLFINKTTVILLTYLSNIISAKYREKYEDLWPLWIPNDLHIIETLNFMTSNASFEPYWIDLNIIKKFFVQHKSYEEIKPLDVDWLGRKCISLIQSMFIDNFISSDVAAQFYKDLSFLKTPEGFNTTDITYFEGCYNLAETYFKDTESSLNEFVVYLKGLYQEKGSLLKGNQVILHHIDANLEFINQFGSALLKLQEVEELTSLDSEIAKNLHGAICTFLGKNIHVQEFPIFTPEDIVVFINHNRNFFAPAVIWLTNQEVLLKEIQLKIL